MYRFVFMRRGCVFVRSLYFVCDVGVLCVIGVNVVCLK